MPVPSFSSGPFAAVLSSVLDSSISLTRSLRMDAAVKRVSQEHDESDDYECQGEERGDAEDDIGHLRGLLAHEDLPVLSGHGAGADPRSRWVLGLLVLVVGVGQGPG